MKNLMLFVLMILSIMILIFGISCEGEVINKPSEGDKQEDSFVIEPDPNSWVFTDKSFYSKFAGVYSFGEMGLRDYIYEIQWENEPYNFGILGIYQISQIIKFGGKDFYGLSLVHLYKISTNTIQDSTDKSHYWLRFSPLGTSFDILGEDLELFTNEFKQLMLPLKYPDDQENEVWEMNFVQSADIEGMGGIDSISVPLSVFGKEFLMTVLKNNVTMVVNTEEIMYRCTGGFFEEELDLLLRVNGIWKIAFGSTNIEVNLNWGVDNVNERLKMHEFGFSGGHGMYLMIDFRDSFKETYGNSLPIRFNTLVNGFLLDDSLYYLPFLAFCIRD